MTSCLIGLGANLGDRRAALDEAVDRLSRHPELELRKKSRWLQTDPVGGPGEQAEFLNGAALLETTLEPRELVAELLSVEKALGRHRTVRWAAREIDLDLLLYGDRVIESPEVTVPHPRMAFRRFVLEPAAQIAPQMVHPQLGWTIERLLENINRRPIVVAVMAADDRLARQIAEKVSAHSGSQHVLNPPPVDLGSVDAGFVESRALELLCDGEESELETPVTPQLVAVVDREDEFTGQQLSLPMVILSAVPRDAAAGEITAAIAAMR